MAAIGTLTTLITPSLSGISTLRSERSSLIAVIGMLTWEISLLTSEIGLLMATSRHAIADISLRTTDFSSLYLPAYTSLCAAWTSQLAK